MSATNIIRTLTLTAVLFALAACGSTRYSGKIIAGSVGRPVIIETADDRVNNQPGIPGLEVTLYNESRSGQAPAQLARTITDEEGKFAISIPSANTPKGTVIIRVTGDGIYSARSKTFLPRGGQLMLFTVVTREPMMENDASASVDPTK